MSQLSEPESKQLSALLARAIANQQFAIRIQTRGLDGEEQYSGNQVQSQEWRVEACECSGERPVDPDNEAGPWEEWIRHEVHVFIGEEEAQFIAGSI